MKCGQVYVSLLGEWGGKGGEGYMWERSNVFAMGKLVGFLPSIELLT